MYVFTVFLSKIGHWKSVVWLWYIGHFCLRLTVVSARLIGQFGPILWGETFDGTYFFLVIATEKIKTLLDKKKCPKTIKYTWITKKFQHLLSGLIL